MISGILPVDKPQGWTSHDVVARVRRLAGQRQVGHAGTLDPLATGLLMVVLGRATRMSAYLMEAQKVYVADIGLGATTVTDDAEAPLLQHRPITGLSQKDVAAALTHFIGDLRQVPPRYAAVRHQGRKLYQLARQGIDVEPAPRAVTVHHIELLYCQPPHVRISVRCGTGTYIRSLARDLGEVLGVGGYLHALRRVESGGFRVTDACSLTELEHLASEGRLAQAVKPADRAVLDWPAAVLDGHQVRVVQSGAAVRLPATASGWIRLYAPTGELLALAEAADALAKPFRVL